MPFPGVFPVSLFAAAFLNKKSLLLDGVDEYVTFGDNHNFENNDPFTLSAWVKMASIPSQSCIWAKATNDANVHGWGVYVTTANKILVQIRSSTQNVNYNSIAAPFSIGTWVHVVVLYDGGQNASGVDVYFDAVKDTANPGGPLISTLLSTAPSQMGRRNAAFPLNGNVDEVTFWDVALNQSQITELYNSGAPSNPQIHSAKANLTNYYPFGDNPLDDATGGTGVIKDSKGSVDGTPENTQPGSIVFDVP